MFNINHQFELINILILSKIQRFLKYIFDTK